MRHLKKISITSSIMKISDDILIEAVGNLLKKENQEDCSAEEIKIVSQEWSSGSTIGEDNYMCLLSQAIKKIYVL